MEWRKLLCLALMSLLFVPATTARIPYAPSPVLDYIRGKRDAEKEAKREMIWALRGGCLYFPLTLLTRYPKPPLLLPDRLLGQSAEYMLGYMENAREETGRRSAGWTWAGFSLITICAAVLRFIDISIFRIAEILRKTVSRDL
jgi:hypothetical protein